MGKSRKIALLVSVLLVLALSVSPVHCFYSNPISETKSFTTTLRVTSPPCADIIPASVLLEIYGRELEENGIYIEFIPSKGPWDMIAHLQRGDVDVALYSLAGGARLYAKGLKELKLVGVFVWKYLYVVGKEDINGWEGLRGKTILIPCRGGCPDMAFRICAKEAGYNPDKDFKIEYLPCAQIMQLLLAGKADAAALPEPHATLLILKSEGKIKIILDLQEEFIRTHPDWTEEGYPGGSLWVVASNVKGKGKAVELFISTFKRAVEYTNKHPSEAGNITGKYLEKYFGRKFPAKAVTESLKSGRLYIEFKEAKSLNATIVKFLRTINYPVPDRRIYYEVAEG